MARPLILAPLSLAAALAAGTAVSDPGPQLTNGVANKLAVYGIRVDPEALTTAQASALHLLLVSERGYLKVRRRAEAILRDPDYRD